MTVPDAGFKLDLHNHTAYSLDGLLSPAALLAAAKARGLDFVAVTDHNTVQGALEAMARAKDDPTLPAVIPGIEVSTQGGEVIGLFVQADIPAGLPLAETIGRIRAQGGLVYLPHPCDRLRRGAVRRRERQTALREADLVEVTNGRSLTRFAGGKAAGLARRAGKPGGAGSDAHRLTEVGQAYVVVDSPPTRENLVSLVARGKVVHHLGFREYLMNWVVQGLSPLTRTRRRLASMWSRR
jgi:predicted metal-dependent phosphoesterase TrpH